MVDVLEVAAEVAALRECLVAVGAGKWSLARVLAEMVPQVTALLENAVAVRVPALEEQLDAVRLLVLDLDGLVPLRRDALESLRVLGVVHVLAALPVIRLLVRIFFR